MLLHRFTSLVSTNDTAKQMALEGAPQGTTVVADYQTGGRGRMGRSFHSPAGSGIYLSRILRPHCSPDKLMHLTCAVAVAVCNAIESVCGFRPGVKWVNDIIANNKKLGGILTEMSLQADGTVLFCVVGIGINLLDAPMPEELSHIATNLEKATGKQIDAEQLIQALMLQLHELELHLSEKDRWLGQYRKDCITLGKQIRVMTNDPYSATAIQVDNDGALLLQLADGTQNTLAAGEVSVRGMYDYLE